MSPPEWFSRLVLDEFVIMPNHLHAVLAFAGHAGGESPSPTTGNTTTKPGGTSPSPTTGNTTTKPGGTSPSPTTGNTTTKPGGTSPSPTLFDVIGAFKSISTIK